MFVANNYCSIKQFLKLSEILNFLKLFKRILFFKAYKMFLEFIPRIIVFQT